MLRKAPPFLLEMPLRFRHLSGVHGSQFLGDDLQRHYLGVSGLRISKRFWEPVKTTQGATDLESLYGEIEPGVWERLVEQREMPPLPVIRGKTIFFHQHLKQHPVAAL